MYFFIIIAVCALVVGWLNISLWNRGKVMVSLGNAALATVTGVFIALVVAAIATAVSTEHTVERWEVTDVSKFTDPDYGTAYSYYNGGLQYDFGNHDREFIRASEEDVTYRTSDCGVTPNHFLPFGNMGECTEYLYVTESDR